MRERLQQFGGFMAGMVIPNIGAFIAWGLITALFIPTGWLAVMGWPGPGARFGPMVGPMIIWMLPVLIGYTGGKMVHGHRGGVMGAIMTIGVIVGVSVTFGSDIPQFLGAMVVGPLGGWIMKQIDEALEDSIPVGFEMLINNFSLGIAGVFLAMLSMWLIGPVMFRISEWLGNGVDFLITNRLLPFAAFIIEPAKVLFLNNALNHGVLAPLGVAEAEQTGRAIHFLLETNPGPGLGLLIAYYVAGKGLMKQSAPGAMIIHFLGGIHEIYFPYVLAHPIMIVSVIAGGFFADLWFNITNAGLVATPSPGSIFAYVAVTPPGQFFPVFGGVLIGAAVSAVVGMAILRFRPVGVGDDVEDEEEIMDSVPGLA